VASIKNAKKPIQAKGAIASRTICLTWLTEASASTTIE